MKIKFLTVDTIEKAAEGAPWACVIIKVAGGYYAFESIDDYAAWGSKQSWTN